MKTKGISLLKRLSDVKLIRKLASETVNNSNVLQDDDELVLPVAAGEIWYITLHLRMTREAGGAQASKIAFTIPAAGSLTTCGTNSNGTTIQADTANDATAAMTFVHNAAPAQVTMRYLYVGGANAGNVQLQWAQLVAEAKDHQVLVNSFIFAQKL